MSITHKESHQRMSEVDQDPDQIHERVVEAVKDIQEQCRQFRKNGELPRPTELILPSLHIEPDIPRDDRLRAVDENRLIYEEIVDTINHENASRYRSDGQIIDGETGGQKYRGVLSFITPEIAILEKYPMDNAGDPIGIEVSLLISRDRVIQQLREIKATA
jgi:hypothetical protein